MKVKLGMENRKYNSSEISSFIKLFRDMYELKQEFLAERANISLRTLERAESGKEKDRPSDNSLKRIAKALMLEEDFFTKIHAIKTKEESEREAREREKNYTKIVLTKSTNAKDIINRLSGSHMYWSDVLINENDEAEELAANLVDYLQDLGDSLDDISETNKLEMRRELQRMIDELEVHGFVVYHAKGKRVAIVGIGNEPKQKTPMRVYYYIIRRDSGDTFQALYPKRSEGWWA